MELFEFFADLILPLLIFTVAGQAIHKRVRGGKKAGGGQHTTAVQSQSQKSNEDIDAMARRTIHIADYGVPNAPTSQTYNSSLPQSYDIEHWKEQLDGFLKAGLIDRAEYQVLLDRRKQCFHDEGHH